MIFRKALKWVKEQNDEKTEIIKNYVKEMKCV